MIARVWHGTTSKENKTAYLKYLRSTGMGAFKEAKGNVGAYILVRDSEELTEYLIVTFWESMTAVKGFAGADFDKTVYLPKDSYFLSSSEATVTHFEVAAKI
jgi:heme-degrading monooxygenase HmoA